MEQDESKELERNQEDDTIYSRMEFSLLSLGQELSLICMIRSIQYNVLTFLTHCGHLENTFMKRMGHKLFIVSV